MPRVLPPGVVHAKAREALATIPFDQALIVGGLARATAANRLKIRHLPWHSGSDADVVVFGISDEEWERWRQSLTGQVSQTRFGGVRYLIDAGMSVDVFRYEHDVHHVGVPIEPVRYPALVPAFSCDQFALTRTMELICPRSAQCQLTLRHLVMNKEPIEPAWGRQRILRALSAGWTICDRARAFFERPANG